ncbi:MULTISPECIES: phosphopantetheine-binding protein [unclassified Streptomyces]|uniref:phosphopantetheine-binding protein n=1 Tax=unclassified Streptomyces TaxID=2593676 RepID=UPI0004C253B4|nr:MULTISPECIES: phosphopantetheine-binding protein [unclassified Streptomyces]
MRGASWDARLEAIVRENCPHLDDDVSLTADDLLVDLGLDSLAMAAIVVQTEETFGFVFPDDELTAETFATMGTVWEAVSRLLATAR